jgi:hypothetical protein
VRTLCALFSWRGRATVGRRWRTRAPRSHGRRWMVEGRQRRLCSSLARQFSQRGHRGMPIMNLAPPGTQYGPCLRECRHRRCAMSRRTASLICPQCNQEIGYGVNFTKEDKRNGRFVHVACSLFGAEAYVPPKMPMVERGQAGGPALAGSFKIQEKQKAVSLAGGPPSLQAQACLGCCSTTCAAARCGI